MNPSSQILDDSTFRSVDNFVNICENTSDFSRHRDRLNAILNDLNSIDFKHVQSPDIFEVGLSHLICLPESKTIC